MREFFPPFCISWQGSRTMYDISSVFLVQTIRGPGWGNLREWQNQVGHAGRDCTASV